MDAHSVRRDAKLNIYTDTIKMKVVFRDFKPDHTSSQSTFKPLLYIKTGETNLIYLQM
jgi:hypothetical protein